MSDVTVDPDFPLENEAARFGEESMFHVLDSSVQRQFGVTGLDPNRLLQEDRAMIDFVVHKVNSRPRHFNSCIEGVPNCVGAGEGRQE